MLAKDIIKQSRGSTNMLWEQHLSDIKKGIPSSCTNPEELYKKYMRTDREILEEYESLGIPIPDKEEYLNGRE